MEERIGFEQFLYGDGKEIVIDDMEFCVDRIIMLPKIRPHQLEKAVSLSIQYCQRAEFRRELLRRSFKCPALIYQLFKKGILVFEEIIPFLGGRDALMLSYYFREYIPYFDSSRSIWRRYDYFSESLLENSENIDKLIEYGFLPLSIEYCLKYDVIDVLQDMEIFDQEIKWSPFEWSNKPKYLDLLSFSGFFGSVKCFKHLLMNDFEINDHVLSMVVCSGCLDLFHLCQIQQSFTDDDIFMASEFFHLPLLVFMIENGADVNSKNYCVVLFKLNLLLFIMLLKMVI